MNEELKKLITPAKIININNQLGYKTFYDAARGLNVNIGVVRSSDMNAGTYNDIEFIMYERYGLWSIEYYAITADPSLETLKSLPNSTGAAIIREGQWSCWTLGYHKNDKTHRALVQTSPIEVIRDFDKDSILDADYILDDRTKVDSVHSLKTATGWIRKGYWQGNLVQVIDYGLFGINNHRASKYKLINWIGLNSQGCMVHLDYNRYMNSFIPLIEESARTYGDKFTITVYTEKRFK